jgi:death on curing protein
LTLPDALDLRWLMTAHVRLIKDFGGGIGVRDVGLLESALNRPLASFEGQPLYRTPFQRAAVLWMGLIRNHGFVDGNKRTATAAMARWLFPEGHHLRSGQDELVEMAVSIANKVYELDEVSAWLEARVEPRCKASPDP